MRMGVCHITAVLFYRLSFDPVFVIPVRDIEKESDAQNMPIIYERLSGQFVSRVFGRHDVHADDALGCPQIKDRIEDGRILRGRESIVVSIGKII